MKLSELKRGDKFVLCDDIEKAPKYSYRPLDVYMITSTSGTGKFINAQTGQAVDFHFPESDIDALRLRL